LQSLVSVKDHELKDVDATVTSLKSQNDGLVDQISSSRLQEKMALYLEEKFYPHLLTAIFCRRWLLTQGMELADGLSAGITHGKEGRSLMDLEAYNPSAEADYVSALQALQSVNFSLFAELKANKDASFETLMDLLRLEKPLVKKLGLHELQPTFDQLMVSIHHSPNQTVIGATALSLALDVSDVRPFSSAALVGTKGTSSVVPAAARTTTTLSMTFASASIIPPITIEDYEFTGVGGLEGTQRSGEVASFPSQLSLKRGVRYYSRA
ncbi:hypothetical protein Tco_0023242, partial [Tanacetum coccineum]